MYFFSCRRRVVITFSVDVSMYRSTPNETVTDPARRAAFASLEDASSRRFRERAVAGRCEKRRFRLLQDAADALRWSARGKDEEERRLTRDAIAALSHRLACVLALVLPPLVALVADGAATRSVLLSFGERRRSIGG